MLAILRPQPIRAEDDSARFTVATELAHDPVLRPYIDELKRTTSSERLDEIGSMTDTELIELHFTYGLWIRNQWLRGHQKPQLIEYLLSKGYGEPDAMSMALIRALWVNLSETASPEDRLRRQAVRRMPKGQIAIAISDFTVEGCTMNQKAEGPVVIATPIFDYPRAALGARMQGTVVLAGRILSGGAVDSLKVEKGLNRLLDTSALRRVQAQTFRSSRCEGEPAAATFRSTVSFLIRQPENRAAALRIAELSNAYEMRHSGIPHLGDEAMAPRAVEHLEPHYPAVAQNTDHVSTSVVVEMVVNARGEVEDPEIMASERADLNPIIIDALGHWKYEPPQEQGKPTAVILTVAVDF